MLATKLLGTLALLVAAVTAQDTVAQPSTNLRGAESDDLAKFLEAWDAAIKAAAANAPVAEEAAAKAPVAEEATTLERGGRCQLSQTEAQRLSLNCDTNHIRFIGIGDWGEKKENSGVRAVRDGILRDAGSVDFIMSVGDNFYDKGVKSVDDSQWQKTWVERFGIGSKLTLPWISILGNHDHYGNAQAEINYASASKPGSRYWVMPDQFYSVDASANGHKMRFVVTDTESMSSSDLEWVQREVNDDSLEFALALGHHHIFSNGGRGDNSDSKMTQLNDVLQASKVKAYFGGHEHDMQILQSGNLDYFMFGGGGRGIHGDDPAPGTNANVVYYALKYGYAIYDLDVAKHKLDVTYKIFNLDGSNAEVKTFSRQY
ncbi:TPA: hypothetical protein N0F65_008208 [Lagenidium giganteum]|uniref:Calcineurin-like phosphoesterase domain-containing protein n=1 Tax=Lagenidium giganteum TaxID=4803 RepID=A0AAV2YYN1_9STRA|nr:TPA: hypothetical protein N0F65_008208 [Lagenidium giganteum]